MCFKCCNIMPFLIKIVVDQNSDFKFTCFISYFRRKTF